MTQITDHLASVRARVRDALTRAGRPPDDALIVAVSKLQTAESIQDAYRAGQRDFGESYVQEALPKIERLPHPEIVWHFIGHVQSNKTRAIAASFQWVHGLDSDRVARRLGAHRSVHAPPLNVLIQVNHGGEQQKAGVAPAAVRALATVVLEQPRLRLRGLTTIPPAGATARQSRACFDELRTLRAQLAGEGLELDLLSMGMSQDFELAIASGSNCVRIGTAIFGDRPPKESAR